MSDPLYGWVWLIWPQALGLVLIVLLFTGPSSRPSETPSWVSPDNAGRIAVMKALRTQAATDPAAETLLTERAKRGDADAAYSMGILLDPDLNPQKASLERMKQSMDWYRAAADKNIPAAQTNLAFLLTEARFGLTPDYVQAVYWLEKAAPQDPQAQRELSVLVEKGLGTPRDPARAMALCQTAADRGDPVALSIMGNALDRGIYGLVVDRAKAVRYYEKAAALGNVFAQRELAKHLQAGDGTPVDKNEAMLWFRRAAAKGDAYSKQQLGEPGATASPMPAPTASPPAISPPAPSAAPNDAKAHIAALIALRDQARTDVDAEAKLSAQADSGDAAAQYFMGTILDPGLDPKKASPDRTKRAETWYRQAAGKGIPLAQANLGVLLSQPGASQNYKEAADWFAKASNAVPLAQTRLGLLYLQGHGVAVDKAKGMALIQAAAARNEPTALAVVGDAYDHGSSGVGKDKQKALASFQRGAALGNLFSERALGIHYMRGDGVPADRKNADYWFEKAAAQGDSFSKAQIASAPRK